MAKTRGSAVEELRLGSAPYSGPPEISRASGQSILAAIKSLRTAGGRSQWVGQGWVMDFGHDSQPLLGLRAQHQGSILEEELRSIRFGLTDARNRAPGIRTGQCAVTVVADNQTAVNLLATPGFTSRSVTAGCAKEHALISSLTAGADVSFDWVRGHAGHTLNNAADRLAVLARRAKEAELSMSERDYLIAGIRETAFLEPMQDLLALAA